MFLLVNLAFFSWMILRCSPCALCIHNPAVPLHWSHRDEWGSLIFLMQERGITAHGICHYPTASVSVGCRLRNGGREVKGKWSYHSHLAFSLDSQLCRAPAFMVLSGHSHLTLSKATWASLLRGWLCVHILLAAVKRLIDRPFFFPSVEMFPVNHSCVTLTVQLVLKDGSWEV